MLDLIKNLQIEISVANYTQLDSSWNTRNFIRERWALPQARLYLPLEGEGFITCNNQRYHLRPGFIYLIPPWCNVEASCPQSLIKYWSHFNAFIHDSKLDIFSFGKYDIEQHVTEHDFYSDLMRRLTINHQVPTYARRKTIDPLEELEATAILKILLRPFFQSLIDHSGENKIGESHILKVIRYIEQHLDEELTLHDLAKISNLHPTYLSNTFAKRMGTSLIKYCNQRRIARAQAMLIGTDYPISEIAALQGAEMSASFSRLFKRHTGFSLSEYRKLMRTNKTNFV